MLYKNITPTMYFHYNGKLNLKREIFLFFLQ